MDGTTEVQSLRHSWWMVGGLDQLRAEWDAPQIPDQVVHHLLDYLEQSAGGSVRWVDGRAAVRVDIRITFRAEEIPF